MYVSYQSIPRASTHPMSRFARRIYYLSAFLVFAIVGPLLVAWTAGYRWSSVRSGFLRTGALSISSEPRATIRLNGIEQGATPFHATHIPAGNYIVELRSPQLRTWQKEISIAQNTALTIGPVTLYPENFSITPWLISGTNVLQTENLSSAYSLTSTDGQWTAQSIWPVRATTVTRLPFAPIQVIPSNNGQTTIWQGPEATVITSKNQTEDAWTVVPFNQPHFDATNENIFFALEKDQVKRYDVFTKTSTIIAPGTSLTTNNDAVWFTQSSTGKTTFFRQSSFGQKNADEMLTLSGSWKFVPGPNGIYLIQNTESLELATLSQAFGESTFTTSLLGRADRWWWTNAGQPPLWLNGSNLMTIDAEKIPQLVDRLSAEPTLVQWILPGHSVLIQNDQLLSMRSVSALQGRGTLIEKTFDQPGRIIGLDLPNRKLLHATNVTPLEVEEFAW